MNADQLTALVDRARHAEAPSTTPWTTPAPDLLTRAREARKHRTTVLVATAAAVVTVAGVTTWVALDTSRGPSVVEPAPAAPDTRLVGGHGVVIAVPTAWSTDTELTNTCPDAATGVVHFVVIPPQGPGGMCTQLPGFDSVAIRTADVPSLGDLAPSGEVGGMPYFEQSETSSRRPTIVLTVPAAHISFASTSHTADDARALLATISAVPAGSVTVDLRSRLAALDGPTPDPYDSQAVSDLDPATGLAERVREVDDAARPGEFLRSDPPLGTPVPPGTTVTYSAGDLDSVVDDPTLRRHGWVVGPATSYEPPIDRVTAERTAATLTGYRQPEQAFLRTVGGRLTWLVAREVFGSAGSGQTRLTAVDVRSGRVTRSIVVPLHHG